MDLDRAPLTGTGSRPGAGPTAKSMLLTVLGELVLRRGGPVWTSTLVTLLTGLGFGEKNARQAIARTAEQGLLDGERMGRRSRWHLSGTALELLGEGTERIFAFLGNGAAWDGRWLVVTFSIPEESRQARARLRKELGFAGFGFPSPGVAVCAHLERADRAREILDRLGVSGACLGFQGETGLLTTDADLVRRSWDLDRLAAGYGRFIATFADRPAPDPSGACLAVTELVHAWRRFPFVDPELPEDLLPAPWPGHSAKALFDRCHSSWLTPALEWFDRLEHEADPSR